MVGIRKREETLSRTRLHRRRRWRREKKLTTADIMEDARISASESGQSFTKIRRHVLSTLLQTEKALTAYEILDRLEGVGASAPPTAYRALDFLVDLGYVKRVESLNAYTALKQGPTDEPIGLFICKTCQAVREIDFPETDNMIDNLMKSQSFDSDSLLLEVHGRCKSETECVMA